MKRKRTSPGRQVGTDRTRQERLASPAGRLHQARTRPEFLQTLPPESLTPELALTAVTAFPRAACWLPETLRVAELALPASQAGMRLPDEAWTPELVLEVAKLGGYEVPAWAWTEEAALELAGADYLGSSFLASPQRVLTEAVATRIIQTERSSFDDWQLFPDEALTGAVLLAGKTKVDLSTWRRFPEPARTEPVLFEVLKSSRQIYGISLSAIPEVLRSERILALKPETVPLHLQTEAELIAILERQEDDGDVNEVLFSLPRSSFSAGLVAWVLDKALRSSFLLPEPWLQKATTMTLTGGGETELTPELVLQQALADPATLNLVAESLVTEELALEFIRARPRALRALPHHARTTAVALAYLAAQKQRTDHNYHFRFTDFPEAELTPELLFRAVQVDELCLYDLSPQIWTWTPATALTLLSALLDNPDEKYGEQSELALHCFRKLPESALSAPLLRLLINAHCIFPQGTPHTLLTRPGLEAIFPEVPSGPQLSDAEFLMELQLFWQTQATNEDGDALVTTGDGDVLPLPQPWEAVQSEAWALRWAAVNPLMLHHFRAEHLSSQVALEAVQCRRFDLFSIVRRLPEASMTEAVWRLALEGGPEWVAFLPQTPAMRAALGEK